MDELLNSINNYFSHQPWWVLALSTALILMVFRRRKSAQAMKLLREYHKRKPHVAHHAHSISGSPSAITVTPRVASKNFESQDSVAQDLGTFLEGGNKIGAIKLVRKETGLDLAGVKVVVEAIGRAS